MILQRLADLLADAAHEIELDRAVGEARRADADENGVRYLGGGCDIAGCREAPGGDLLAEHLAYLRLDDRRLTLVDERDFALVDVDAGDFVSHFCETTGDDRADVPEPHDADSHRSMTSLFVVTGFERSHDRSLSPAAVG